MATPAYVLERRAVTVPRVLTAEEKARIRARLAEAIRSFWASPEGQMLRMELSNAARSLGWDKAMEDIMATVKDTIKAEAERLGLSEVYRRIWGK